MKTLFMTLALVLPLILMGQKASDISNLDDKTLWETFQSRIETAVENGDLTREEARKKYAGFRKRMAKKRMAKSNKEKPNL